LVVFSGNSREDMVRAAPLAILRTGDAEGLGEPTAMESVGGAGWTALAMMAAERASVEVVTPCRAKKWRSRSTARKTRRPAAASVVPMMVPTSRSLGFR
jgi:hypothetical protein